MISQKNSGVSVARNNGIREAQGEFIALLDADDEWKPAYLSTLVNLTKTYPECSVFCTKYIMRDRTGKENENIMHKVAFKGTDGVMTNYFEVAACSHPPICSISIMARRGVFESVGGFPLDIKSGEDLLTWARLACRYKIAYSMKPLAIFNIEGYDVKEKPKRMPADVDYVGHELKKLQEEFHAPGLRAYRGLWHKMRASVYMRLKMRGEAYRETLKSLCLNPLNYKTWAYLIVNSLP